MTDPRIPKVPAETKAPRHHAEEVVGFGTLEVWDDLGLLLPRWRGAAAELAEFESPLQIERLRRATTPAQLQAALPAVSADPRRGLLRAALPSLLADLLDRGFNWLFHSSNHDRPLPIKALTRWEQRDLAYRIDPERGAQVERISCARDADCGGVHAWIAIFDRQQPWVCFVYHLNIDSAAIVPPTPLMVINERLAWRP